MPGDMVLAKLTSKGKTETIITQQNKWQLVMPTLPLPLSLNIITWYVDTVREKPLAWDDETGCLTVD
jgi:hypothetical protein